MKPNSLKNWILLGDNLPILEGMESESVSLIYIDPPFNTGRVQSRTRIKTTVAVDGDRTGFGGKRYKTEVVGKSGYADSFADYMGFLRPRLQEAHRVLTANGSLFFHIDWREAARCRLLLEDIFGGAAHCINEIIWSYEFGAKANKRWSQKHDNIYWFAKDPNNYIFNYENIEYIPYLSPGLAGEEKAARGKTLTDTWWETVVPTNSKEKTGYPTQKPVPIVRRIVSMHSNPGDIVLDFFAGSGTTGMAAQQTKRRYILIDDNPFAVKIMQKRLRVAEKIAPAKISGKNSEIFESIANEIGRTCKVRKEWEGSPYQWLYLAASATKGKHGRDLVGRFLSECWQIPVKKVGNKLEIGKTTLLTKLSLLWSTGHYAFEQIRDNDVYDYLFLLGISPFDVNAWIISKSDAEKYATEQHGHGNRWLRIHPQNKADWPKCLQKQSGRIGDIKPSIIDRNSLSKRLHIGS